MLLLASPTDESSDKLPGLTVLSSPMDSSPRPDSSQVLRDCLSAPELGSLSPSGTAVLVHTAIMLSVLSEAQALLVLGH